MYANLAVSITPLPVTRRANGYAHYDEEVAACAIEIENGQATITLDSPEEGSSYSNPAGERVVNLSTHAIAVAADY